MKSRIAKFLFFAIAGLILAGCRAWHDGYIANSASLSSPNFIYVNRDIRGHSKISYVFGFGGTWQESLVHAAKLDMMRSNVIRDNQALVNITSNIKTTWFLFGIVIWKECLLTADVVQFIDTDHPAAVQEIKPTEVKSVNRLEKNYSRGQDTIAIGDKVYYDLKGHIAFCEVVEIDQTQFTLRPMLEREEKFTIKNTEPVFRTKGSLGGYNVEETVKAKFYLAYETCIIKGFSGDQALVKMGFEFQIIPIQKLKKSEGK